MVSNDKTLTTTEIAGLRENHRPYNATEKDIDAIIEKGNLEWESFNGKLYLCMRW